MSSSRKDSTKKISEVDLLDALKKGLLKNLEEDIVHLAVERSEFENENLLFFIIKNKYETALNWIIENIASSEIDKAFLESCLKDQKNRSMWNNLLELNPKISAKLLMKLNDKTIIDTINRNKDIIFSDRIMKNFYREKSWMDPKLFVNIFFVIRSNLYDSATDRMKLDDEDLRFYSGSLDWRECLEDMEFKNRLALLQTQSRYPNDGARNATFNAKTGGTLNKQSLPDQNENFIKKLDSLRQLVFSCANKYAEHKGGWFDKVSFEKKTQFEKIEDTLAKEIINLKEGKTVTLDEICVKLFKAVSDAIKTAEERKFLFIFQKKDDDYSKALRKLLLTLALQLKPSAEKVNMALSSSNDLTSKINWEKHSDSELLALVKRADIKKLCESITHIGGQTLFDSMIKNKQLKTLEYILSHNDISLEIWVKSFKTITKANNNYVIPQYNLAEILLRKLKEEKSWEDPKIFLMLFALFEQQFLRVAHWDKDPTLECFLREKIIESRRAILAMADHYQFSKDFEQGYHDKWGGPINTKRFWNLDESSVKQLINLRELVFSCREQYAKQKNGEKNISREEYHILAQLEKTFSEQISPTKVKPEDIQEIYFTMTDAVTKAIATAPTEEKTSFFGLFKKKNDTFSKALKKLQLELTFFALEKFNPKKDVNAEEKKNTSP